MPALMDTLPDASQHDDVMAHTAHQLNASMARVRRARQLLLEASDRLSQTRHEVEKDPHLERVRQARELLHGANQHLAQTRQQVEEDQRQSTARPAADDDPMMSAATPGPTATQEAGTPSGGTPTPEPPPAIRTEEANQHRPGSGV